MISVPSIIRDLIKAESTRKNIHITFPNLDHTDIDGDQIDDDSFRFSESLCSGNDFTLGIVESPSVEFTTVGIENIKGKTIFVEEEIIIPSDVPTIAGERTNSKFQLRVYPIPIGKFKISSCDRENNIERRKVSAIADLIDDKVTILTDYLNFIKFPWFDHTPSRLYLDDLISLYFYNPTEIVNSNTETKTYTQQLSWINPKLTFQWAGSLKAVVESTCIGVDLVNNMDYPEHNNSQTPLDTITYGDVANKTIDSRSFISYKFNPTGENPSSWNDYISECNAVVNDVREFMSQYIDPDIDVIAYDKESVTWEPGFYNIDDNTPSSGHAKGEEVYNSSTRYVRSNFIKRSDILKYDFGILYSMTEPGSQLVPPSNFLHDCRLYICYWNVYKKPVENRVDGWMEEIYETLFDDDGLNNYILDDDCEYIAFAIDCYDNDDDYREDCFEEFEKTIRNCIGVDVLSMLHFCRPEKILRYPETFVQGNTKGTFESSVITEITNTLISNYDEMFYNNGGINNLFDANYNNNVTPAMGFNIMAQGQEQFEHAIPITDQIGSAFSFTKYCITDYKQNSFPYEDIVCPIEYVKNWCNTSIIFPVHLKITITGGLGPEHAQVYEYDWTNKGFEILTSDQVDRVNYINKEHLTETNLSIYEEEALHVDFNRTVKHKEERQKIKAHYEIGLSGEWEYAKIDEKAKEDRTEFLPDTSELESIPIRSMLASFAEMNGKIGRINRYGVFELVNLSNYIDGLTPTLALTPDTTLYPHGPSAGTMYPILYKSCTYNDFPTKPFGKVTVTFNNGLNDDNGKTTQSYYIPGEYPNGYRTYDISGNWVFENGIFTPDQIKGILTTIGENLKNIIYTGCDIDLLGRVDIEAGDSINVTDINGDSFDTIIFKRTLTGCQLQEDNFETNVDDESDTVSGGSYTSSSSSNSGNSGGGSYNSSVRSVNGMYGDVKISHTYDENTKTLTFVNLIKS